MIFKNVLYKTYTTILVRNSLKTLIDNYGFVFIFFYFQSNNTRLNCLYYQKPYVRFSVSTLRRPIVAAVHPCAVRFRRLKSRVFLFRIPPRSSSLGDIGPERRRDSKKKKNLSLWSRSVMITTNRTRERGREHCTRLCYFFFFFWFRVNEITKF